MARTKALPCLAAVLAVACSKAPPKIVVGSKNFTEQLVLGEILAQQIERTLHVSVERKLNLGGTLLAHQALAAGSIDLYPEYTGTALAAVLKTSQPGVRTEVLPYVRKEYKHRWNLAWMRPFGFNNTFAMVVRREGNENIRTLTEAARRPRPWRIGAGYEFLQRADGLPGLLRTYGLPVAGQPVTMDLGLLYQALMNKQVDMVAANSTDGQLSSLPVEVLDDDKDYFPPYECAAVVRQQTLDAYAGLQAALDSLSGRIDDKTMRRLNYSVAGEHRRIPDVARDFLASLQ